MQNLDYLMHLPYRRQYLEELSPENANFSLEYYPQEYPGSGNLDFRPAACQIMQANGSRTVEFQYASHRIFQGKLKWEGLPAVYVESSEEADTLEITMTDKLLSMFGIQLSIRRELAILKDFGANG